MKYLLITAIVFLSSCSWLDKGPKVSISQTDSGYTATITDEKTGATISINDINFDTDGSVEFRDVAIDTQFVGEAQ